MASSITTIHIDVDPIDVSEYPVRCHKEKPMIDAYDKTLCDDNKDFTNFLNKCLLLEQTIEMEKIVGKILLPAYVQADNEYKKSVKFTRVIRKALQRLIEEPHKKYSHISNVTDTLKFHVKRKPKRVNFITLSTTSVLGKTNETSRKRTVNIEKTKTSKKPKLDIIAVDVEDDDLMIVEDPVKATVSDDSTTVRDSARKIHNDNLIATHDTAKILSGKTACYDKVNITESDCGLININQEANKKKVFNSVATVIPSKSNSKVKNKTNEKLKTSKYTPPIIFESDDEICKEPSSNIKDNKSKENYPPNVTLQIENLSNNNLPVVVLDRQDIKLQEKQFHKNENTAIVNFDTNTLEHKDTHHNENLDINENLCNSNNKLLVPQMEIVLEDTSSKLNDIKRYERIKVIETEILKYKMKIADLQLAEVVDDSDASAYIRCGRLQAHIVKLYKELCTLNNAESVKRRKVRLRHVAEGLPAGPVRRLENFLNKQTDSDGVAPFPDYADVVRCVEKSNVKDGLGWSKAKVHKEAQALFEYCGRALQKRRQRREWKDLRHQVSPEDFAADPAASDPELAAKLELNRQLALKKEAEILTKFSRMEHASDKVSVQRGNKNEDTDHYNSSNRNTPERAESERLFKESETKIGEDQTNEDEVELVIHIKEEPCEVPIYFSLDTSLVIDISDSDSSDDSCEE